MAYETRWLSMIVFLAFFPQQCSERPFPQGSVENINCLTKKYITKKEEDRLVKYSGYFKRTIPEKKIVSVGRNFTYECCGKNDAIFKWGLYEQGTVSPSRLFSRVEVTKANTSCWVSWTSDFSKSGYSGRTFVEYNTTSQCVKWITTRVTKEDENTFVASFRDNFTRGQGFKECPPVILKVSKEPRPTAPKPPTSPKIPLTSPRPPHYTTTSKPEATTSVASPTATSKQPPESPKPTLSTEASKTSNSTQWIVGVILSLAAVVFTISLIIIWLARVKRKRSNGGKVFFKGTSDQSEARVRLAPSDSD